MKHNGMVVVALALGLVACKKDTGDKGAPGKQPVRTSLPPELTRRPAGVDTTKLAVPPLFAYVPADTAYLIGSFEPIPLEYFDKMFTKIGPAVSKALDQLGDQVSDPQGVALIDAIRSELDGKWSVAGVESLGLSAQPHFAIYGLPVVPVVARMDVKDDKAVLATIQRIAAKAGRTLPAPETRGSTTFWKLVKDKSTFVVSLGDDQLVLAVGPTDLVEQKLGLVLGTEKPAAASDGKALEQVMADHGYAPYIVGFLDSKRFLDDVVTMARADKTEDNPPSDVCAGELQRLAGRAPKLVLGYEELTLKRQTMSFEVELAPDLLAELSALRTQVPGLGTALSNQPLMAFGGGIDLAGAQRFLIAAMQSWNKAYVACNMGKDKGKVDLSDAIASVSKPMPPELAQITGGVATVQDVAFGPGGPLPDRIDGFLLVTATDAKALYAALLKQQPKLAALGIATDGKLHELPKGRLPMPFVINAGVGDHAFAVGVGATGKTLGEQMLGASGGGPVPFLAFTYDYGRLIDLSMQVKRMQGKTDPTDDLNKALSELFSRGNMTLDTNAKGLALWTSLDMK
ncbi:MAG TPA: hypothetical protein VHE35_33610 [Kofleriaceae bacterium]|nr:hypothetical protein [Kofleriaceae bacterium]